MLIESYTKNKGHKIKKIFTSTLWLDNICSWKTVVAGRLLKQLIVVIWRRKEDIKLNCGRQQRLITNHAKLI